MRAAPDAVPDHPPRRFAPRRLPKLHSAASVGETFSISRPIPPAAREVASKSGLNVKFFTGDNLTVNRNGGTMSVRGYIRGNQVLIRADHPFYTAEQLMKHEAGHDLIAKGKVDPEAVRERLKETVGDENLDEISRLYAAAYEGSGLTADEIWEECICDSLGDMNIFAHDADISEVANARLLEVKEAAQTDTESRETRGPPQGKTSRETVDSYDNNFKKQIENWDQKTIGFAFVVGKTSDALLEAGIPDKQIRWDASKIKALLEKHSGMSINTVKEIPDLLQNPIVVIDSKKNENAKIVLGDLYDEHNKIVTAVLLLTPTSKKGNKLDLIKISSAEGRGHIESLFRKENGDPVEVRYFDKKRIQDWLNVNRLQLPLHSFNPDSLTEKNISLVNNSIPQNPDLSSTSSKNSENFSRETAFEADRRYLDAVESGDERAMRETVEAAAVAWGAQTDARGKPIMLYHGTESFGFTEVDIGQSVDGVAFFATDSENVAAGYAGEDGAQLRTRIGDINSEQNKNGIYSLYFKSGEQLTVSCFGSDWDSIKTPARMRSQIKSDTTTTWRIAQWAKEQGYDSVRFRDVTDTGIYAVGVEASDVYAFFDGNSVRSADSVTYDNGGEVIPISERFDESKRDIRYSQELDFIDYINENADAQNTKKRRTPAQRVDDQKLVDEMYYGILIKNQTVNSIYARQK